MPLKAIKDICNLYSGFPLSSKNFVEQGNTRVILGADISHYPAYVMGNDKEISIESSMIGISNLAEQSKNNPKFLKEVQMPNLSNEKRLHVGDVIFRSRGYPLDKLVAYTPFPNEKSNLLKQKPYIISNTFILLRPKNEVLPQYLEWSINNFRNEFNQHVSRGVSLYTISISQLKEVILPVPSIEVQKRILSAFDEIQKAKAIAEAKEYIEIEMLRGIAQKHSRKE